jgi:hypothetical protein
MNQQQREIADLKERLAKFEGAKKAPFVPAPSAPFDPLDKVFSEQGIRGHLPEWMRDMASAVPSNTVRAIVGDHSKPAPAVPKAAPVVRGSGWIDARPLRQDYVRECDALADAAARRERGR